MKVLFVVSGNMGLYLGRLLAKKDYLLLRNIAKALLIGFYKKNFLVFILKKRYPSTFSY